MERAKEEREILQLALKAGRILLENGAEIFRVEDTIYRICRHYNLNTVTVFVLSNGIFLTAGEQEETQFAKVIQIPVNHANLSRVAEVNQLSRRISAGECTLAEIRDELERIENTPDFPKKMRILAAGIAGSCFCYMFKGHWQDIVCCFFIGVLFYAYLICIGKPYLSKIVCTILGSCWVTILAVLCYKLHLGLKLESMMISGIILMVPGMAFTNAVRDMTDGDYISGFVRMLDAILVFFCIAIGVGFVLSLYRTLTGGVLLW